jgi:hypothetical protein
MEASDGTMETGEGGRFRLDRRFGLRMMDPWPRRGKSMLLSLDASQLLVNTIEFQMVRIKVTATSNEIQRKKKGFVRRLLLIDTKELS